MADLDGWKVTVLIVAVFYTAMALAALIFLFSLLRLIPQHRSAQIVETTISLNYTTMLNNTRKCLGEFWTSCLA